MHQPMKNEEVLLKQLKALKSKKSALIPGKPNYMEQDYNEMLNKLVNKFSISSSLSAFHCLDLSYICKGKIE